MFVVLLIAGFFLGLGYVIGASKLAQASPIGTRTGWKSSYPVVQWSAVL